MIKGFGAMFKKSETEVEKKEPLPKMKKCFITKDDYKMYIILDRDNNEVTKTETTKDDVKKVILKDRESIWSFCNSGRDRMPELDWEQIEIDINNYIDDNNVMILDRPLLSHERPPEWMKRK